MSDKTIEEQLNEAFEEHTDIADPADIVDTPEPVEIIEEPTVDPVEEIAPVEETHKLDAPQSWTADEKAEWANMSPKAQATAIRRENDFHKMVTSHEGDLRLGREMKSVIDPFLPSIKEAGAEPKALIHDLLGTVNTLRNGTEEQKIMVMQNIAKGYNVDLNKVMGYQQNPINQLYGELNSLKQQYNPDAILNMLQERQEGDKIQSEVNAFAADPKNVHFEVLKPFMSALLTSGQAKDLREAYDMASYANPETRSTMLNASKEAEAAKRKQEIASKKNASVSVKGSPSLVQGNTKSPVRTIEEELSAQFDAIHGSKL